MPLNAPISIVLKFYLNQSTMLKSLSFDDLPKAVCHLSEEIREIKLMLAQHIEPQLPLQQDQILTVEEAAAFLRLSVPTVRSKTSRGELPFMKKGNRVYLSMSDLMDYLKSGKRKSNAEIQTEAESYLSGRKEGSHVRR